MNQELFQVFYRIRNCDAVAMMAALSTEKEKNKLLLLIIFRLRVYKNILPSLICVTDHSTPMSLLTLAMEWDDLQCYRFCVVLNCGLFVKSYRY